MRFKTMAVLALLLTGPATAQKVTEIRPEVHPLTQGNVNAWLEGLVPYALEAGDLAGAAVAVVANGEVLTLRGFGSADAATGQPVDPNQTLFRMGSISKLITWTAVMQLVERGVLDLDADINDYLDFAIPPFGGLPVTLRQVMTHTSGFEEQLKFVFVHDETYQLTLDQLVREHTPARIFPPGTTPAYSNYATALAGYIVQRASGQAYNDYADDHIFTPLGMETATFSQILSREQQTKLANGYAIASGPPSPFELVSATPAGSMTATAADMAKFMLAHLNDGALGGNRILRTETVREMHARQSAAIPALNGMTLGFWESSINGRRVISQPGDTGVFHSSLNLFVNDGVGLFIAINSTGTDGAATKLRSILFTQFADRYFPPRAVSAPEVIGDNNASLMAGQWTSSRSSATNFVSFTELLSPVVVSVDDQGNLASDDLPILGAAVRDWIEVEPFLWHASNSAERLAAVVENGRVTQFSLDTLAPIVVFQPVPWHRAASWLGPALLLSCAILTLTAIQWPIAAVVRRRHGRRLGLTPPSRAAYHGVRLAALITVATFAGWTVFVTTIFTDLTLLSARTDPLLLTLQGLTIACTLALGAGAAANAIFAVRERRGFWSVLWAAALTFATIVVVWVAFVFNLLKVSVLY